MRSAIVLGGAISFVSMASLLTTGCMSEGIEREALDLRSEDADDGENTATAASALTATGLSNTTIWPRVPRAITTGGKKVIVLPIRFVGRGQPTTSVGLTNTRFMRQLLIGEGCPSTECFGDPHATLSNQLWRWSYGNTWFDSVEVVDRWISGKTRAEYYTGGGLLPYDIIRDAFALSGKNPSDYDTAVVVWDTVLSGAAPCFAAPAAITRTIMINGLAANYHSWCLVHEMGHLLGLTHANAWSQRTTPWGPGGTELNCHDITDPMGFGHPFDFGSFNKWRMQWQRTSSVIQATRSGVYRIYQFDDTPSRIDRPMAVTFMRDGTAAYWISYRSLPVSGMNFSNGVQIHEVRRDAVPRLLDMNTPNDTNRNDAALVVGRSYRDTTARVTIRTVAVGGRGSDKWADVELTTF